MVWCWFIHYFGFIWFTGTVQFWQFVPLYDLVLVYTLFRLIHCLFSTRFLFLNWVVFFYSEFRFKYIVLITWKNTKTQQRNKNNKPKNTTKSEQNTTNFVLTLFWLCGILFWLCSDFVVFFVFLFLFLCCVLVFFHVISTIYLKRNSE
jgi:hypothetical protein